MWPSRTVQLVFGTGVEVREQLDEEQHDEDRVEHQLRPPGVAYSADGPIIRDPLIELVALRHLLARAGAALRRPENKRDEGG